jgi:RNA polymerase sigma factor (sigma-70 family)
VSLSDGQLLRSFLHQNDEAAFEALVGRHGPMVRGVCRRLLRNCHDADDAFQAAFLVLIRKAPTLAAREVIGDWLHGVAYRTALKARTAAARRRMKEKQALRSEAIVVEYDRPEWMSLLDQEIARLPAKYRLPIVLCDLEGRTRKEAAQQLGWPDGTLSGRLSRARALLARRLNRRGVTLSVGALVAGLSSEATARVPFSLLSSTCKAAMEFASKSTAGSVPAHVVVLTEGVVKAMFLSKLKKIAAVLMAALVVTAGAGVWRYAALAGPDEQRPPQKPAQTAPAIDRASVPKVTTLGPAPKAPPHFQIDLKIIEKENGQSKLLLQPSIRVLEGVAASFVSGGAQTVRLGGGTMEQVEVGSSVHVVIRADEGGKVRLDLMVCRPSNVIHQPVQRPSQRSYEDAEIVETRTIRLLCSVKPGEPVTFHIGGKASLALEVTANVEEVKEVLDINTIAAAKKDLKRAESHQRSGQHDSALTCYERICQRYPDTIYAERAKERLAELKKPKEKPPARVGQIFISGNKKLSDEGILRRVPLLPGQILSFPDLDIAERNLARLKGLKSAQVSVIDRVGEGVYKDIQITVEEK